MNHSLNKNWSTQLITESLKDSLIDRYAIVLYKLKDTIDRYALICSI